MFKKILIANRGEIAVRVIKTCKRMGIETLAVYSDADQFSCHTLIADGSVCLGDPRSSKSYLSHEKIIQAARDNNCDAIHPGYGFLSENEIFAQAVKDAGLTFIGPPPSAIALLGDKIASKKVAEKAGMPTVPGYSNPIAHEAEALAQAEEIGYPVILKPAAGGGGKGMHIVISQDKLPAALAQSRQEAKKAFGSDKILLERYISAPRHIEIQIMADSFGNAIYLGERECSIQRRYQKIIEEAPSVAVTPELRKQMGEAACNLAKQAGYTNAGTVEFMLDQDGKFYFLEMNTRLQVEHPVTELITGLDLVELQLQIASGQPLPITQEQVSLNGWAMEARICAEDSGKDFVPSTGMITRYAEPKGKNVRVDSGFHAGSRISIYYDSLMAKVIAWGETREAARQTLVDALNGYHVEGPLTNIDFANAILNHPLFVEGQLSTDFIAENMEALLNRSDPPAYQLHYMVLAAALVHHNRRNLVVESLKPMASNVGGQKEKIHPIAYMVKAGADILSVRLEPGKETHHWTIMVEDRQYQVETPEFEFYRRRIKLLINGQTHRFRLQNQGSFLWAAFCGITRTIEIYDPKEWELISHMPIPVKHRPDNVLECPMPGLVVDIRAKKGDKVYRGQELIILESMKMESGVASPCDGEIAEVLVNIGQAVESGDILINFVI
ncbi:MAG: acetyl-CoA carboxylase biotin carboxylase subunit [Desulfobacula sp.]|jgi:propionyl-CoA carboxylase alpha chain|nr:acetyl-CoA carboxylase biotin carboxylase subunit [Desulfobacula sp.]